jgi:YggT family protein
MLVFLLRLILLLFELATLFIVLRAIVSWLFPKASNPLTKILNELTEPFLAPLRRILPTLWGLDFSPFIAVVILQVLVQLILRYGLKAV